MSCCRLFGGCCACFARVLLGGSSFHSRHCWACVGCCGQRQGAGAILASRFVSRVWHDHALLLHRVTGVLSQHVPQPWHTCCENSVANQGLHKSGSFSSYCGPIVKRCTAHVPHHGDASTWSLTATVRCHLDSCWCPVGWQPSQCHCRGDRN